MSGGELGSLPQVATDFVEVAREVYAALGIGHAESVYENACVVGLMERDYKVIEQQRTIEVFYLGRHVGTGRVDLCIGDTLVVELKADQSSIGEKHVSQVVKYMESLSKPWGLVLNFPQPGAKPGDFSMISYVAVKRTADGMVRGPNVSE